MVATDHHKPIFRNLDGIRFIAFLCVFFSHTFYSQDPATGKSTLYQSVNFLLGQWGDFGLSVFFVMSGFLITYLLMCERQATGRVHVFSFYARRILRIWPLYFAIVLFNFFLYAPLAKHQELTQHQMPYYFFWANMDTVAHGFSGGVIDHLWAISVEEQFYFVLPLIMLVAPDRRLNYVFIAVIAIASIFRIAHYLEPHMIFYHSISASFDIAIGGLAAWLMFFKSKAKEFVAQLSSTTIAVTYTAFGFLILFQRNIFDSSQLIVFVLIAQLFALFIIVEQNYATHSLMKLGETKWVSDLGKYSYGFFCYHIVCIRVIEGIIANLNMTGPITTTLLIPFAGLALTIGVGVVSYRLFETPFLNLKKRFSYLN
ncbi:MAG TPA: acyltransferase [Cyclobacteriaceae bacterium]|nr:acyltransferase [Cyclobacteriaceae bacterium]